MGGLSIVVPVFNEKECIGECVREIRRVFSGTDYELICVDDGSTDGSGEILRTLAAGDGRMTCVSLETNRGYTDAVLAGFARCRKEYVSFLDADLQYHPEELMNMFRFAVDGDRDCVRGLPKRKYYKLFRRLLSAAYNLYVAALFGTYFRDANALKLMRRRYLDAINFRYGYGMIELELLLGFLRQGVRIDTFPIRTRERRAGTSKCSTRLVWRTLVDCVRLRRNLDTLVILG